jgi:hypothetical protein
VCYNLCAQITLYSVRLCACVGVSVRVCVCACVCVRACMKFNLLWERRSVGRMSCCELLVMLSLCKWYSLIQSEVVNIVE